LFEEYFGLIEAGFVFGLAVAFYIWQRRDLRRYEKKDREETEMKHAKAENLDQRQP
jgi:predicted histidine transporter YuiF (NhaC family)